MRVSKEADVMGALQGGGQEGLNALINAYGAYMHAIVTRVLGTYASREDVEECVADCVVAVWKQAEAIQQGSIKAYVGTVARNSAIDLRRKRAREGFLPLEEDVIAGGENVLEALEKRETAAALQAELMAFPPPDREIFLRRYYLGEELKTIGEAVKLSERAVEGRLRRGRERLRKRLGGMHNG